MVRDEYVRQKRAAGGAKSLDNPNVPQKKDSEIIIDKDTIKDGDKVSLSPSPSSSSSSSSFNNNTIINSDIKKFIDFAFVEYKKKFKDPLIITGNKDGKLVKILLAYFSLDRLKDLWINFLNMNDEWVNQTGRNIGIFFIKINNLTSGNQNKDNSILKSDYMETLKAKAKKMGIKTVVLTGKSGTELAKAADLSLLVPSGVTARIQEAHITIGHILCELIEQELCSETK